MDNKKKIYLNKINHVIETIKDKIKNEKSIKEELFYLEEVYDFLKQEDPEELEVVAVIEEGLSDYREYESQLINKRKEQANNKKIRRLKLQKLDEYKMAWNKKSVLFRLFHDRIKPSNIVINTIDVDFLDDNIHFLNKKR